MLAGFRALEFARGAHLFSVCSWARNGRRVEYRRDAGGGDVADPSARPRSRYGTEHLGLGAGGRSAYRVDRARPSASELARGIFCRLAAGAADTVDPKERSRIGNVEATLRPC